MIKPGVKGRAFLLAFIPMIFITSVLSFYFINAQLRDVDELIVSHGKSVARHIAQASEFGVFSGDNEILEKIIQASIYEKDVESLTITNLTGIKLASTTREKINKKENNNSNKKIFRHPITLKTTAIIDDFDNPIIPENDLEILGWVITEISTDRLVERQNTIINNSIYIISMGMLISALLAIWIGRGLTIPISRITSSVRDIERGNLDITIKNISTGEIGHLEQGVKSMLGKIRLNQYELQRQVDKSTHELQESLKLLSNKNHELTVARLKATQANETKSRFLANMSHEIRTPMNGILGFVRLLKDSNITREQNDYLETINKSATNLLSLINDILDISKIESGKLNIKKVLFNLEECIEDAIMLMAPAAQEKGLVLTKFIYTDTPTSIYAPHDRISQILINYLGNAIKFSEHGTIVVRTMINPDDNKPNTIMVSVSDEGIGIPNDEENNLFKAFNQIDDTNTKSYKGTGLGLAISKSLAEAMGGKAGFESELGNGSNFWFTFQYSKDSSQPVFHNIQKPFNGKIALLYDENEHTRRSIYADLANLGYTAHKYSDLNDFSNSLKNNVSYDLCILSLPMDQNIQNQINDALSEIDAISKSRILILSSSAEINHDTFLSNIDTKSYISKPYRRKDLAESLLRLSESSSIPNLKPLTPCDAEDKTNIHGHLPNNHTLNGHNILIAEDNEINTKLLVSILKTEGANIFQAKNGEEAIELFKKNTIDIVLMDIHMPVMNGIEATKIIRKSEMRGSYTPILGITANAMDEDKIEIKSSGIDNLIIKPISVDNLLGQIKYWSKNKREIPHINMGKRNPEKTFNQLGINEKLASSLLEMLLSELPEIRNQLNKHFTSSNWGELREKMHKLIGGIAYCDVPELKRAALLFQTSLKNNNSSHENEFKFLLSEIDSLLSG